MASVTLRGGKHGHLFEGNSYPCYHHRCREQLRCCSSCLLQLHGTRQTPTCSDTVGLRRSA